MIVTKHKKDREQLEAEIDDKRHVIKKYENEFKEISNQKIIMKK
jgi:hypothetical protein